MKKGNSGYDPKKKGERKRKTVRGCIVGEDIRTLAVKVVKKGDLEIPGNFTYLKNKLKLDTRYLLFEKQFKTKLFKFHIFNRLN